VATLRDHTRRVWEKHRPDDPGITAEYARRVGETFADAPAARFVQQLRNYTLHRRLAVARGRLSMTAGGGFQSRVILVRDDLLEWGGWSPPARAYLEAAENHVGLDDVVAEYTTRVTTFNDWFGHAFVAAHLPAFDELTRLERLLGSAYQSKADAD
jgi:hypothetical protein